MRLAEERNSNKSELRDSLGGTGANLDELVMVLEDFDTALAFGSFTLIATDGV